MTRYYQERKRINVSTVKSMVDPLVFYQQEGQQVIAAGNRIWVTAGLCPFHDDRSEGSFFINIENGAFKCFSCGAKGGDIIAFIMQKQGVSFREALELLSAIGGL